MAGNVMSQCRHCRIAPDEVHIKHGYGKHNNNNGFTCVGPVWPMSATCERHIPTHKHKRIIFTRRLDQYSHVFSPRLWSNDMKRNPFLSIAAHRFVCCVTSMSIFVHVFARESRWLFTNLLCPVNPLSSILYLLTLYAVITIHAE